MGDFGISKVLTGTSAEAHTTVGTPFYISPEMVSLLLCLLCLYCYLCILFVCMHMCVYVPSVKEGHTILRVTFGL